MKKLIVFLIVALTFSSCGLVDIRSNEGFRLFLYGEFIGQKNVCIQSLDGFSVNGNTYEESVFDRPVTVKNISTQPIDVKITDQESGSRWVQIPASGEVILELPPVEL